MPTQNPMLTPELELRSEELYQQLLQAVSSIAQELLPPKALAYVREWVAPYEAMHATHTLLNIWNMVGEAMYAAHVTRQKGERPYTGEWHDNQCSLYEMLVYDPE